MAKIGVFDSGIGGLSILDEALRVSPSHEYLYFADSANAPYGEKSSDWITQRSLEISQFLVRQKCDAIVIACNTATTGAIAKIRAELPNTPIIGVEPGIKPAAMVSENKIVGVLATANTLKSDKFNALLATLPADCQFINQAGIGLVPLIENGELDNPEIDRLLEKYLSPMIEAGADTLVLGCTHYPFLAEKIQSQYGNRLKLIDTSLAIIRQMNKLVNAQDTNQSNKGPIHFYSTADGNQLLNKAKVLMASDLAMHLLDAQTVQV